MTIKEDESSPRGKDDDDGAPVRAHHKRRRESAEDGDDENHEMRNESATHEGENLKIIGAAASSNHSANEDIAQSSEWNNTTKQVGHVFHMSKWEGYC